MLIDHTHKRWALGSLLAFLLTAAIYATYAIISISPLDGGSGLGLVFGFLGYGLIVFATLLGLRKRFPVWRVGRVQAWMRGHLWLGLLSYPLILFHAGFSFGSGLTRLLMWLLTAVVISGVAGAALQHFMPRLMTQQVAMETIYGQIGRVRGQLLAEADALIASLPEIEAEPVVLGDSRARPASLLEEQAAAVARLRAVYGEHIRPFLGNARGEPEFASRTSASVFFEDLRKKSGEEARPLVDDLENICQEKADIDRQEKLHRVLHGWLLLHIPLSYALAILGLIHAIGGLWYS